MKQIAHQIGLTLGSSKAVANLLYAKLRLHGRFEVMAADRINLLAEIDRLKSAAAEIERLKVK